MSDTTTSSGVKRREFLKVLGAGAATATAIGCSQERVERLMNRGVEGRHSNFSAGLGACLRAYGQ
jgi:hypothetical protein